MVAAVSVSISKCGASVESVERSRTRKGNVKGKEKKDEATLVDQPGMSTAKYSTTKMGLVETQTCEKGRQKRPTRALST